MRDTGAISAVLRINLILIALMSVSLLIDILYGDLEGRNLLTFTIPLGASLILFIPYFLIRKPYTKFRKARRYKLTMVFFLYLVGFSSIPFMLGSGMDPISALFESMAGWTTTGLSNVDAASLAGDSHGLLFFRCAIQWAGGLFYLVVAFMIISDINDIAKRSADQKLISRVGMVPHLSKLLSTLAILYGFFTFFSFILIHIGGRTIFDSVCLSMGTVSTGGFGPDGRLVDGSIPLHMILVLFMALSGMGYYVHMSVFSAKGRLRTLLDNENLFYLATIITVPIISVMILTTSDLTLGQSVWRGIFSAVSAITTTGFMIEGMNDWPGALKLLLLLMMLMGGSSLSLASGFKMQRVLLLTKGFLGEVKRSSHPRAVISLRRGEGIYSGKALEAANVTFFYLFTILGASIMALLIFKGDILSVISICVTAVSNSGIAFGEFAGPDGVESIGYVPKIILLLVMFLGRFDIMLPLFFLSPGSYRFNG